MAMDEMAENALAIGRTQAEAVLAFRERALQLRSRALEAHPGPMHLRSQTVTAEGVAIAQPAMTSTAGVLVAEGDSWFDYPFHDVLEELEDRHAYDVESVAHHGDPIEEMAYSGNQLEELTRRIEKVLRRGITPKAILLSGGGNDVAGTEFGMLLNHARSAIAGLNLSVVEGVVNQRIRTAYVTILSAVTQICQSKAGQVLPILIHGYDYPVPDGRGFLGGWGPLPGPWLEPGFREKGFENLEQRISIAHDLIERFNIMVEAIPTLTGLGHVKFVDLRNTLRTDAHYKDWWANELHPTEPGFHAIAEKFATVLATLPSPPPPHP
jgi:lysophospholipase L1-like esterase